MIRAKQTLKGRTSVESVIRGEDGATFIPEVDADGTLKWSNDKHLPNPEPVNIKGPPPTNEQIVSAVSDYMDENGIKRVTAKVENGALIVM